MIRGGRLALSVKRAKRDAAYLFGGLAKAERDVSRPFFLLRAPTAEEVRRDALLTGRQAVPGLLPARPSRGVCV
jgi:hypothetical protein